MALIVQKFGGTSVATEEAREALLSHVKLAIKQGDTVVLVVSAMGRLGEPYATDTLIGLLESISPEIAPRKKDLIMSCGEIISCSMIAHLLESRGIPAEPLTGAQAGILTSDEFGSSEIINIDTTGIREILKNGKVAVVAGFQGSTESGEITTLGRGGSDTAAVVLGGYMKADRVDIFTDVKGIAKVDPRIVPEATYIPEISYGDMYRLADQGAKVIHPRAVKAAQAFSIPVRVRSTFNEETGTLISEAHGVHTHGVTGMAIQKNDEKDTGNIFILFTADQFEQVHQSLTDYHREKMAFAQLDWGDNCVTVSCDLGSINHTVKQLYDFLHRS